MDTKMLLDLMNFLPISVYFKDCEGRFEMVSKQKAENAVTTPEEMVRKTDFDFMTEDAAKRAWADDRIVMETGKPICGKIEKKVRRDGSEAFSITTRAPRYDDDGKLVGIMGISHDITKMMEYEDAMRSLFLSESHDIKSPLVAANDNILDILKYVHIDLLAVELKVKSSLMEIALLGFDDDNDLKPSHMSSRINLLDDIIEPIIYAYSNQIAERKIAVINNITDNIILRAQRTWISSVFDNVFSNSIKHGDHGCVVTMKASLENSRIVIAVSNTGQPLDANFVKERLFRKFQRQDDRVEGSGIGLYASKKLMQMMHGDIYYHEPEGHPEFCFWIPL